MLRKTIFSLSFLFVIMAFSMPQELLSQKVAFISSDMIREYYPDAKQAEQRVQSLVDEWKRELDARKQEIEALEFEIKKNRLIWTKQEKMEKEKKLKDIKLSREQYAQSKFAPEGEYDQLAKNLLGIIEAKIQAAIHDVGIDHGFDIIFDQSIHPLPYVNYKYDMTINVLRKLGVDTKELEKELKEKIKKDPRNKKKKSRSPRRGRRTKKTDQKKDVNPDRDFDQKKIIGSPTDIKSIETIPLLESKEESKSTETEEKAKETEEEGKGK